MSKFLNYINKYEKIKRPIQIFIYICIVIAIIATLIGVVLGLKSCSKRDDIIEAKNFISDNVIVHDNFKIKIISAKSVNEIEIYKNRDDIEKTKLTGNYISISLQLNKLETSREKDHKLDIDDFKLKDHTGLYIPLNTIMTFFNIDALDMHVDTDENGFILSNADFPTKKSVKDYSWVGQYVTEEIKEFTIYFQMKDGYKVEEDVMILEVDFYTGQSGIKRGEDIVLVECIRQ